MKIEEQIKLLNWINKVEVPYFLYTRIQQRIKNNLENRLNPSIAWALSLSFVVLFLLNLFVIHRSSMKNVPQLNSIVSGMHLLQNNSMYNE